MTCGGVKVEKIPIQQTNCMKCMELVLSELDRGKGIEQILQVEENK
ncbi:hypothetical protein [Metabacillus bambusae]|uniref:Uncharacterized protein n=1 Tax=Metabacillus bambusae TaxID=2795218 RepID=A0ABS3NBK2_9BACI|nr:hypothetical protein [Metabacillus bambusae]MBO1515671.1 hypothetical protein [Metabacillus bambusae]